MAIEKSLQDLVVEYRYIPNKNSMEAQALLGQIEQATRQMPHTERAGVLKQIRESNIAVQGQEPRQDNVYDMMLQIHCELLAEGWVGKMSDHVMRIRNGNQQLTTQEMEGFICETLTRLNEQDPAQYRMFVQSVNNFVVPKDKNGVELSGKALGVNMEAARLLRNIVNDFDMRTTRGLDTTKQNDNDGMEM